MSTAAREYKMPMKVKGAVLEPLSWQDYLWQNREARQEQLREVLRSDMTLREFKARLHGLTYSDLVWLVQVSDIPLPEEIRSLLDAVIEIFESKDAPRSPGSWYERQFLKPNERGIVCQRK